MSDTAAAASAAGSTKPSTPAELVELVGAVAVGDFEAAKEIYRDELLTWARTLPGMDNRAFRDAAEGAILDSSLVSSFRGNWSHSHFKASACFHESERRKLLEHTEECRVTTLYDRAYNAVVRSQCHPSLEGKERACTCKPKS